MTERVLVAYATKLGSTAEIAAVIAEVLVAAGLEAEALPARQVRDLGPYGAVVLGSALYAAHWQRDANRFLVHHREALRERRVRLFSSGPLDYRLAVKNLPITTHAAEIGLLDITAQPHVHKVADRDHRGLEGIDIA